MTWRNDIVGCALIAAVMSSFAGAQVGAIPDAPLPSVVVPGHAIAPVMVPIRDDEAPAASTGTQFGWAAPVEGSRMLPAEAIVERRFPFIRVDLEDLGPVATVPRSTRGALPASTSVRAFPWPGYVIARNAGV